MSDSASVEPVLRDQRPDSWAAHWRAVGPKLKAIRQRELRNFDHERERAAIDALLEMAVAHARPRTTSGLVQLHRRLRKLYL